MSGSIGKQTADTAPYTKTTALDAQHPMGAGAALLPGSKGGALGRVQDSVLAGARDSALAPEALPLGG